MIMFRELAADLRQLGKQAKSIANGARSLEQMQLIRTIRNEHTVASDGTAQCMA